nr:hypothetical protein [uncultured Carboxylicivirga sp.]
MQKYEIPDTRWEAYCRSYDDYISKYIFKGRFISTVPKDILMDYETVEHLLAHAWYHYPMYDEGFKKLLGIVEMAVKFRCEQLEISLDLELKNGNKRRKSLNQLMNELHKKEPEKKLKFAFEKARKIRNHYAHPERHSFVGAIAQLGIPQVINTINSVFSTIESFVSALEYHEELDIKRKHFENGCFVMEYKNNRFLVHSIKSVESWRVKEDWISFWIINPITLNPKEELENQRYTYPIHIGLKNVEISEESITAIDLATGDQIRVSHSNNKKDLDVRKQYLKIWSEVSKENINVYLAALDQKLGEELTKHRYLYYWF